MDVQRERSDVFRGTVIGNPILVIYSEPNPRTATVAVGGGKIVEPRRGKIWTSGINE